MRGACSQIPALLSVGLAAVILFISFRGLAVSLPAQDFASFWAAAHLAENDPYSPGPVSQFQKSSGLHTREDDLTMRNPPWALIFVLPLRWMSYPSAFAFWGVLSFTVVAASARGAWRLYTTSSSSMSAFVSLLFGPTICLLILGQLAFLVLLGVTVFFIAVEHRRDWVAGASLLLVLLKPHITLLLVSATVFWVIYYRRWKVICGAALALAASSLFAIAVNVHVFEQYLRLVRLVVREEVPYANLSGMIYAISGSHALALLPEVAGAIWLIVYCLRHRATWDWKTHGLLVLLVSLVCSYYTYSYDEVIALPALLAAAARGNRRMFFLGFLPTNIAYALYISNIAGRFGFNYMFLSWTGLAWLLTYLLSQRRPANQAYAETAGH